MPCCCPTPAFPRATGSEFVARGWNSWGGKLSTDLMSITDETVARPDIDQTRTAAMGGSFGGYMANWVAGHTDRFRAIVTHASLWALDQFAGTTDNSAYWQRHLHAPRRWSSYSCRTASSATSGLLLSRHPRRSGLSRAHR